MNTIDMVLRSLGVLLIFYRAILISDRWNSRYATLRTFCAEWRERVKNTGILALPTFLALLACHGHILKPQGGVRREYR